MFLGWHFLFACSDTSCCGMYR